MGAAGSWERPVQQVTEIRDDALKWSGSLSYFTPYAARHSGGRWQRQYRSNCLEHGLRGLNACALSLIVQDRNVHQQAYNRGTWPSGLWFYTTVSLPKHGGLAEIDGSHVEIFLGPRVFRVTAPWSLLKSARGFLETWPRHLHPLVEGYVGINGDWHRDDAMEGQLTQAISRREYLRLLDRNRLCSRRHM